MNWVMLSQNSDSRKRRKKTGLTNKIKQKFMRKSKRYKNDQCIVRQISCVEKKPKAYEYEVLKEPNRKIFFFLLEIPFFHVPMRNGE